MNCTPLAVASLSIASSSVLFDSIVKGTALLVLAAVVAAILSRDSAATRHRIWLLAMAATLMVPVLSALLPQWRVLPRWAGILPEAVVAETSLPSILGSADGAIEMPRNADAAEVGRPTAIARQPAVEVPDSEPSLAPADVAAEPAAGSWNWINALPLAWAIGFSVLILRLTVARWMLWNIERRATVVGSSARPAKATDDPLATVLMFARLQLGIRRPITLLIHPEKTIPITWGVFRYYLLLPAAAQQWSGEQLRSVMLHELAHIRRRDTTTQLLAHVACALYWFNPLVWLAAWRLRVEGERACDDLVLASGVRPSAYAGHLLDVVAGLSPVRGTQSCGLAMARKSSLEGRLLAVLSGNLNRRGISVVLAAITLAATVCIAVPIAMLRAADDKWDPPQAAHVGGNDFSSYCVHDGTNAAFVVAYRGYFGSASDHSFNPKSRTWHDAVTLALKTKDGEKEVVLRRDHTAPEKLTLAGKDYDLTQGRVFLVSDDGETIRQLAMNPPSIRTTEAAGVLAAQIAAVAPQTREQPSVTKPQGGVADREAAAGKPRPKSKEGQTLFKQWQANARIDGKIPGGLVGRLGKNVRGFISANKGDSENGRKLSEEFEKLLPRFDATRDWTPSDAIAIIDDVSAIHTSPLLSYRDSSERNAMRGGEPLPAELANAPWGKPSPDGLRVARLLEPRAKEYPLGTPLKSRILVYNAGKKTAIFIMPDYQDSWFAAHDANGAAINKSLRIAVTGIPQKRTYRLMPGMYCESPTSGVGVGANARERYWIDAKPGDIVRFTPTSVAVNCSPLLIGTGPDGRPRDFDPKDAADLLAQIIAERVERELPLPVAAAEREQLLRRVTLDLFGQLPTPQEIAAFVADKTPAAVANLEKRLAQRPDVAPFTGTLSPGDIHFRVLAPAPDGAKKPNTVTTDTKVKGGETNAEAAAGKPRPKSNEGQKLFKYWRAYARTDGKIPGALIGGLGEIVKWEIAHNNGGRDRTARYKKLLPRFDVTHDWSPSDAVALIDDVSAIDTNPIGAPLFAADENMIRAGRPLPAELADVAWGKPTADGLRVAWLLEPRAKQYPLNTALKSHVLVHNSGKKTAVFCNWSWVEGGGSAHDAKGAALTVSVTPWLVEATRKTYRLAPGEYCETLAAGVDVGLAAKPDNTDWAGMHVGARIDVKPGDDVRFSPCDVPLLSGAADGADLWTRIVAERVGRELPLPAAAAERTQIIRRVTLDLCGQSPTPQEIAAFVADDPSTAQAALVKRLLNRPGVAPFTGTLSPGEIQFRVLAPIPDAAKKPRAAIAFTGSQVLENLKKYDAIFEAGFSASGTEEGKWLVDIKSGASVDVKRRWKVTCDKDRFAYTNDAIDHEKTLGLKPIRTAIWGYWGPDLSGHYYEDTWFDVSPDGKETEKGKSPTAVVCGPKDIRNNRSKYVFLYALGRMFSKDLDKITRVEKSKDGLLVVSALGADARITHAPFSSGRWELEIDPAADWMVRKARFYSSTWAGIWTEMTNSGTARSGPYCIPKEATINCDGPIGKKILTRRLTFDAAVGKFDENLYSTVRQSVGYNKDPRLTVVDERVSPPVFDVPRAPPASVAPSVPAKSTGAMKTPAITASQVLENLKKHDAIYESGFSVSGTMEEQFPFNADTGERRREERRWKFTHDGNRWGWKGEVIHFEIPGNPKVGSEMVVRTRAWGYGGNDAAGAYYQDTNFRVTAKNETTETGKGPMVVLYGPRDRHGAVGVYYYMWALGRMFSKELDKVTRVEKSKDGLIVVSARGKNAVWQNNGRWELEIEPNAAWMVRKARYYAPHYVDGKRECLYVEMTNSGTVRSGSYCIPKKATINIFAVVGKENARRMTFDPVVGKFDEKLYSDVQQAVAHNKEPNLKLDDERVSPRTFTEPNRPKPEFGPAKE